MGWIQDVAALNSSSLSSSSSSLTRDTELEDAKPFLQQDSDRSPREPSHKRSTSSSSRAGVTFSGRRKRIFILLGVVVVILLVSAAVFPRTEWTAMREKVKVDDSKVAGGEKTIHGGGKIKSEMGKGKIVPEKPATPEEPLKPDTNPEESITSKNPGNYIVSALGGDRHFHAPLGDTFLPRVAPYNIYRPPPGKSKARTPLFIGFTRNHHMLTQTLLSYISAGWPRSEIIIVDNSGTQNANPLGRLSPKNPFYLDYEKLRRRYGVNIIRTPTLLTFSQLQNFYISQALEAGWEYFYWSHMDIALMSEEGKSPYKSAYQRILEDLEEVLEKWGQLDKIKTVDDDTESTDSKRQSSPSEHANSELESEFPAPPDANNDATVSESSSPDPDLDRRWTPTLPAGVTATDWGLRYYQYDWLTLVNVRAMEKVKGWDFFIPYYITDCDFVDRVKMAGLNISEGNVGKIYDLYAHLPDPESRFFPSAEELESMPPKGPGGTRYKALREELNRMSIEKSSAKDRNTWQNELKGGLGEPWTYSPTGFHRAWWEVNTVGGRVYKKKWGMGGCGLVEAGVVLKDEWGGQ